MIHRLEIDELWKEKQQVSFTYPKNLTINKARKVVQGLQNLSITYVLYCLSKKKNLCFVFRLFD